jgi:hypothetical protein
MRISLMVLTCFLISDLAVCCSCSTSGVGGDKPFSLTKTLECSCLGAGGLASNYCGIDSAEDAKIDFTQLLVRSAQANVSPTFLGCLAIHYSAGACCTHFSFGFSRADVSPTSLGSLATHYVARASLFKAAGLSICQLHNGAVRPKPLWSVSMSNFVVPTCLLKLLVTCRMARKTMEGAAVFCPAALHICQLYCYAGAAVKVPANYRYARSALLWQMTSLCRHSAQQITKVVSPGLLYFIPSVPGGVGFVSSLLGLVPNALFVADICESFPAARAEFGNLLSAISGFLLLPHAEGAICAGGPCWHQGVHLPSTTLPSSEP